MRILLTGAAGLLGRATARQLVAAGHTVTGIDAHPHPNVHPDVDFVAAPLAGPILHELADGADVVLHLAPVEPAEPGIDGLVRVAHSAARAGARLIFVSAAAGSPELYGQAEMLAAGGWAPNLVVRIAPLVGRQLDWMICRSVVGLLDSGAAGPVRVLHFDDLLRFLVLAVATNSTGRVDLAGPDAIDATAARALLRAGNPYPRLRRLPGWDRLRPDLDPTVLQEGWRFEFAWAATDALADTARGLTGRRLGGFGAPTRPGKLPLPCEVDLPTEPVDGAQLVAALPDEQEGEFDDRADPRFPVFSAVPLAETLPGPLTPMTLDVQIGGLRAAARTIGTVLASDDLVTSEWSSRAVAVFGHRPYVGVSAGAYVAERLPGWDCRELVHTSVSSANSLFPLGPPPQSGRLGAAQAKALVLTRALAMLRHLKTETQTYVDAAAAEHLAAAQLSSLSNAQLQARVRLLRARIHQGWALTGLWLVDSGVTAATVERRGVHVTVSGLGALLDSETVGAVSSSLASLIRGESRMCASAIDGDLAAISAESPAVGEAFATAVARVGHRGPGEVELANLMIGDDPAIMLAAAGRAAIELSPRMPSTGSEKLSERLAASARASRELAYDTTIRFTHELRMTLRELGSRFVSTELIDVAGEIFYLTVDEAVTVPSDARLRIKRRRAERERFQSLRLPDIVTVS